MTNEKKKRKQKPKKGKVVRLTPDLVRLISKEQGEGETVASTIRRLLAFEGDIVYVLPSDIHEEIEDARGIAVLRAVRKGRGRGTIERPVVLRRP